MHMSQYKLSFNDVGTTTVPATDLAVGEVGVVVNVDYEEHHRDPANPTEVAIRDSNGHVIYLPSCGYDKAEVVTVRRLRPGESVTLTCIANDNDLGDVEGANE
jgi:hypothetical protein